MIIINNRKKLMPHLIAFCREVTDLQSPVYRGERGKTTPTPIFFELRPNIPQYLTVIIMYSKAVN